MSSSKSKSSSTNTTRTVDKRTTDTINAGVGGDIEDSTVWSGVDGDVNQESLSVTDFSEVDNSVDGSRSSWDDYDNSIGDNSNVFESITGGVHITDAGAFTLVENVMSSLIESQEVVLDSANKLASNSVNTLGVVASGDQVKQVQAANKDLITVAKVAGVAAAGYATVKVVEKLKS